MNNEDCQSGKLLEKFYCKGKQSAPTCVCECVRLGELPHDCTLLGMNQ